MQPSGNRRLPWRIYNWRNELIGERASADTAKREIDRDRSIKGYVRVRNINSGVTWERKRGVWFQTGLRTARRRRGVG